MSTVKFLMFSGKGGVGKTTSAAAAAVHYAELGKRTLLFSTDPAHSLSDSLGQEIGDQIRSVHGVPNLAALELNPEKMLQDVKEKFKEEIVRMLTTTTYLDEADVAGAFSLTIPGLDEIMGLKRIMDFMEDSDYDLYIWDTAPTGHTLRLLAMPDVLNEWVRVLARMRWKYKQMVVQLVRREPDYSPEDDLLLSWKKTVKKVSELLKEPEKNMLIGVTIPEAMAVNETRRMNETLKSYGISMRHLLINNVITENRTCGFCQRKREVQQLHIAAIHREFPTCKIIEISQYAGEVNGIESLKEFARQCSKILPTE